VLLAAISQGVPTLLLASLFGPSSAGLYTLAVRLLKLPVFVFSNAVGKVFLPRIAEVARRGGDLQYHLLQTTLMLTVVGLIPFGAIFAAGPTFFGLVFGSAWVTAGEYARWLSVWLYLWFVSIPCVQAIRVLGLQAQNLLFEVLVLIVRSGTICAGALVLHDEMSAVALFASGSALLEALRNVWVIARSRNTLRGGTC